MLLPRASPMAGTGAPRQGLAAVQWVSCWTSITTCKQLSIAHSGQGYFKAPEASAAS